MKVVIKIGVTHLWTIWITLFFSTWIFVSVDQIVCPLYCCRKEELPLLLLPLAIIASSWSPMICGELVLTGAASHPRSFFGI